MSRQRRGPWAQLFKNFIDSFKPRQSTQVGYFIGNDLNGNKFYEVPADPEKGNRTPRRWFVPEKDMHFDVSNMSAEWDAWLRNRRKIPPTIEELKNNLAIAEMKKAGAERLKLKDANDTCPALPNPKHPSMTSFPQYSDYEVTPGEGKIRFKDDDQTYNKK